MVRYRNLSSIGIFFALLVVVNVGVTNLAFAQGLSLIRDTEIENTIRAYATPVFEAGKLSPESIRIRLVNDESLNAFVTAGNQMFLHTGLLIAAKNSGEVIGVIAHETGHIVGGHAVTFGASLEAAMKTTLLTTLLGVAAGVATGNSDIAMAGVLGGQSIAQRQILSFNRGQESAADQFALKALDATEQSAQGLYDFFGRLSGQELLLTSNQDPYVRTHPLTRNRMASVGFHVANSAYSESSLDADLERQHSRMVAKLYSFLKPQYLTLQKYPSTDLSIEGRYARSVAYYRRGQLDKSVPLIDNLIAEYPADPYFWELKGQMLFENGRLENAIEAYRQANELMPFEPLFLVAMAHAMVESGDPVYMKETQEALRIALQEDSTNIFAWDLSAKSYAIADEPGMSAYAAAERAFIIGQFGEVARHANKAEELLERGTPMWVRLQDLKLSAKSYMKEIIERQRKR